MAFDKNDFYILHAILGKHEKETDLTSEIIREFVTGAHSKAFPKEYLDIDPADVDEYCAKLETRFLVLHETGHSISKRSHQPWYGTRRSSAGFEQFYYDRYEEFLSSQDGFPRESVRAVDKETSEIIDFCGDPTSGIGWRRRGLVIGQVQSGKTTSFSGVICKAADVGYKIIVVLTGTTKILRKQTQNRLDAAFVGRRSVSNQGALRELVGVGLIDRSRSPDSGTSVEHDFSINAARHNAGYSLINRKEPIIFVCNKNASTLDNLDKYFKEQGGQNLLDLPLLLIDDEADNASVNTKAHKEEITKINELIRSILRRFKKRSYLGYTATPFANIFIDADDDKEWAEDDLFPQDYIKTIDAPSNYVGPSQIFPHYDENKEIVGIIDDNEPYDDQNKEIVRVIDDNEPYMKETYPRGQAQITGIPESLKKAIGIFLLSKCLRHTRQSQAFHSSMLINISHITNLHFVTTEFVKEFFDTLRKDIKVNAKAIRPSKNSLVHFLKDVYVHEFLENQVVIAPPAWEEILNILAAAASNVEILTINSKSDDQLNFDLKQYPDGRSVIALGGFSLSRGITLEGLTVSYVIRKVSQYDTLMQMGRWFGYRDGYADLCRVFLTPSTLDYYQFITEATDELRNSIKEMQSLGQTPDEFGLLVRQHPAAIRITASNKMHSAQEITLDLGMRGKTYQGHALHNSNEINNKNRDAVNQFVSQMGAPTLDHDYFGKTPLLWPDVSSHKIRDFMLNFNLPDKCFELHVSQTSRQLGSFVTDFIFDPKNKDALSSWVVAIDPIIAPCAGLQHDKFSNVEFQCTKRHKGLFADPNENSIYNITNRRTVQSGLDARVGLTKSEYKEWESTTLDNRSNSTIKTFLSKPLLLIYSLDLKPANLTHENRLNFKNPAVSYLVHFPNKESLKNVSHTYQANKIFQKFQDNFFEEAEDEEDASHA